MRRIKVLSLLLSTILSASLFGQALTFEIEGPSEACDGKFEEWKVKTSDDASFPCDLYQVSWDIEDFSAGIFSNVGTGKIFNYSVNYQPSTGVRTFQIRAHITCNVNGQQTTFEDFKIVKVVHPHYFELFLNSILSCSSNSLNFTLEGPSGILTDNNLRNISWEYPPSWAVTSGGGTSNITFNTSSGVEGINKVKVKYEAVRRKDIGGGIIDKKKCHDKTAIEMELNVTACLSNILYTVNPANPFSHSGLGTSFDGSINLPSNDYDFVAGKSVDLNSDFDFKALTTDQLNLFIEPCGCNSQYLDPNYIGDINVEISNHFLGKNSFSDLQNSNSSQEDIKDIKNEDLEIYPVPISQYLNANNLPVNSEVRVILSKMSGQVVSSSTIKVSTSGTISVDLSTFSQGLYVIVLEHTGGLHRELIMKE